MSRVGDMLRHRDPAPSTATVYDDGVPRQVVTRVSSQRHLAFILMEAQRCRDNGDHVGERANLCQAVFCAATEGAGKLSATELIELLDGLGPFDVVPGAGDEDVWRG